MAVRTGKTRLQQFGECDMKLNLALGPMRTGTTTLFDQCVSYLSKHPGNYVGSDSVAVIDAETGLDVDISRLITKENTSLLPLWN